MQNTSQKKSLTYIIFAIVVLMIITTLVYGNGVRMIIEEENLNNEEINVLYGKLLGIVELDDDSKSITISIYKVPGWNNESVIYGHFKNLIDLIQNKGFDKYEKIKYQGFEDFVYLDANNTGIKEALHFTIYKEQIESIKEKRNISTYEFENYISDYWVNPIMKKI